MASSGKGGGKFELFQQRNVKKKGMETMYLVASTVRGGLKERIRDNKKGLLKLWQRTKTSEHPEIFFGDFSGGAPQVCLAVREGTGKTRT